jgi:hypothetical protein
MAAALEQPQEEVNEYSGEPELPKSLLYSFTVALRGPSLESASSTELLVGAIINASDAVYTRPLEVAAAANRSSGAVAGSPGAVPGSWVPGPVLAEGYGLDTITITVQAGSVREHSWAEGTCS